MAPVDGSSCTCPGSGAPMTAPPMALIGVSCITPLPPVVHAAGLSGLLNVTAMRKLLFGSGDFGSTLITCGLL